MGPTLPAPEIQAFDGRYIVRDDLLPGGTKQRFLYDYISKLQYTEFVYASPAYGYAQVALSYACAALGRKSHIFTARRAVLHKRTLEAMEAGAAVTQVPHGYLSNVQAKARAYAASHRAKLIPFGVDDPDFITAIAQCAAGLDVSPSEIWCAAGSGTLSRALQIAWPKASHNAIQVGSAPNIGNARLWVAPEKFEADAKMPPPFPSCSNYDAKVWRFFKQQSSPGALFWNVAA